VIHKSFFLAFALLQDVPRVTMWTVRAGLSTAPLRSASAHGLSHEFTVIPSLSCPNRAGSYFTSTLSPTPTGETLTTVAPRGDCAIHQGPAGGTRLSAVRTRSSSTACWARSRNRRASSLYAAR